MGTRATSWMMSLGTCRAVSDLMRSAQICESHLTASVSCSARTLRGRWEEVKPVMSTCARRLIARLRSFAPLSHRNTFAPARTSPFPATIRACVTPALPAEDTLPTQPSQRNARRLSPISARRRQSHGRRPDASPGTRACGSSYLRCRPSLFQVSHRFLPSEKDLTVCKKALRARVLHQHHDVLAGRRSMARERRGWCANHHSRTSSSHVLSQRQEYPSLGLSPARFNAASSGTIRPTGACADYSPMLLVHQSYGRATSLRLSSQHPTSISSCLYLIRQISPRSSTPSGDIDALIHRYDIETATALDSGGTQPPAHCDVVRNHRVCMTRPGRGYV
jgi:hypothetical protein